MLENCKSNNIFLQKCILEDFHTFNEQANDAKKSYMQNKI